MGGKCSEVKVEVAKKKKTQVKYRFSQKLLKYSNEVLVLRYFTTLPYNVVIVWANQNLVPGFFKVFLRYIWRWCSG